MLEVNDIHTYYGESHVLHGLSLQIKEGQVVALLGRNGMGKTTTIRSVIGFAPPRRGSIVYKGQDITHLPPHRIANLGIGLVPQGRRIFPSLSVMENLTVAARSSTRAGSYTLERVEEIFPILKERAKIKGTLLSGGEQQMLAIGRALMTNPDLLLMDEPSESLAPKIVKEIGEIIRTLKKNGISILLVEQNLNLACENSDLTCVINKGAIACQLTPAELIGNEEVKIKYLGVSK